MKWITREKVKVDRVACPWLIRKFIDPEAVFIFVPADQVESEARELSATPFDIEGCVLGHHGEDVSFNSILKKYKLTDPALELLGEIVRAADSHPSNPHPAGEGLRWVAFGFNALVCRMRAARFGKEGEPMNQHEVFLDSLRHVARAGPAPKAFGVAAAKSWPVRAGLAGGGSSAQCRVQSAAAEDPLGWRKGSSIGDGWARESASRKNPRRAGDGVSDGGRR